MKIAVIYGGNSEEAKVSNDTGNSIAKGLAKKGHIVKSFEIPEPEIISILNQLKQYDVIFIGYHGGFGENGRIQTIFELQNICFTGSGSQASAMCMNKIFSKLIFQAIDIPTPKWITVESSTRTDESIDAIFEFGLNLPLVVKPPNQGSTIGVTIAHTKEDLVKGLEISKPYSDKILIEEYIAGREITVAMFNDEPLPVVEIVTESGFYNYEHKYTKGKSEYLVPAPISTNVFSRAQNLALKAYQTLGCRHYARVDFRLSHDEELFCLEVNTLPGMTDISLVPIAAKAIGIDFPSLVEKIAILAKNSGGNNV